MTIRLPLTYLLGLLLAGVAPVSAQSRLSLDVRDLDIYDAVRLLATQAAINVVLDGAVPHRTVNLRLQNVTFDVALATLAQSNGLLITRVGQVVYMGDPDALNRRYPAGKKTAAGIRLPLRYADTADVARELTDALPAGTIVVPDHRSSSIIFSGSDAALRRARDLVKALDFGGGGPTTIGMRFVKASDALKALQATAAIVPPDSAYANDRQNQILLSGGAAFVARASAILEAADRPGRQVRYEVRVTDISASDTNNIGVLFGGIDEQGQQRAGSGSTVTTFMRNSLALNATIDAMVTKGTAKILARPTISSLNAVPASLLVGQQYPIVYFDARTGTQQVQFVNVGVNLSVTPTIGNDGSITTDLETDYSQITGSLANFPIISTRRAQSTLRVRDGETIVIAGLFSDVDERTLTKVPLLGDIPILGELFRNRERTSSHDEVVFLITPYLVNDVPGDN